MLILKRSTAEHVLSWEAMIIISSSSSSNIDISRSSSMTVIVVVSTISSAHAGLHRAHGS